MTDHEPHELRTRQDICEAEFVVALTWGLARDASADALRYHAAATGLSLHAAALDVLATEVPEPTEPADRQPWPDVAPPLGRRGGHRHLHALPPVAADGPTRPGDGAGARHRDC